MRRTPHWPSRCTIKSLTVSVMALAGSAEQTLGTRSLMQHPCHTRTSGEPKGNAAFARSALRNPYRRACKFFRRGSSTASAGECDQLFVQLRRNLDAFRDGLLRQRLPTFTRQAHSGLGGHRRNQRFDPLVVHRASGERARIDDQERLADPWPVAFVDKEARRLETQ